MKSIKLRDVLWLATGMLLAACTAGEPAGTGGRLTLFTRVAGSPTRATVDNTWSGGEQVQVRFVDDEVTFTFTVDDEGLLSGTRYWQSEDECIRAVWAWHPASWTMQVDQSTVDKYQAADFIFADVQDITPANASLNPLTFYHKTAKVTANLSAGDGIPDVSDATVAFFGYTSGGADVYDGTLSGDATGWITPLKSDNSHAALLIPRSYIGEEFIKVTLDGFDYLYTPATLGLVAGHSYTFNITVNKTGLAVATNSALSWSEGDVIEVEAVPAVHVLTLEGLQDGDVVTVEYTDGTGSTIPVASNVAHLLATPDGDKIIRGIRINDGEEIPVGRAEGDLHLKFDGSSRKLVFRAPVNGSIPIGSYAEFQLINTAPGGTYKQEADLDLMDKPWTPVGSSYNLFTGLFDGGGYTLANLNVDQSEGEEEEDAAGLFGFISGGARLSNIAIVSGEVKGKQSVGGVCGLILYDPCIIEACYNRATVSGGSCVGGVCGLITINASGSIIRACYNSGEVSGGTNVGGVCGTVDPWDALLIACYNSGTVSGTSSTTVSGVRGGEINNNGVVIACYTVSNATYEEIEFGPDAWPAESIHEAWKPRDDGGYWKSLGGWYDGVPVYPQLWFEK